MRAWIGLGSNLEEPAEQVRRALANLANSPGIEVAAQSSLYRSEPWGVVDQPWFVNAVVVVETARSVDELWSCLSRLEQAAGRIRARRFGPRTLDLDLLGYGDKVQESSTITLPHPRLTERSFVLVPLAEADPSWRHPVSGLSATDLLAKLEREGNTARLERWIDKTEEAFT